MKKLFFIIIAMLLMICGQSGQIFATEAAEPEGSGTSGEPYLIATLANLRWMSEDADNTELGKHFKQTADIDASDTDLWNDGKGFEPIGSYKDTTDPTWKEFQGTYDGQGYTISNLTINRPTEDIYGLFGRIRNSTLRNIKIRDVNVHGSNYVGALSGVMWNSSSIENCSSTGNIHASGDYVGGLVGDAGGTSTNITDSYSNVNIYISRTSGTSQFIGGLVGYFYIGNITSSFATGDVFGFIESGSFLQYKAGGLVGALACTSPSDSMIIDSYSTGSVFSYNNEYGGLVGTTQCSIIRSYSSGSVKNTQTSTYRLGGLVGRALGSYTVTDSFWDIQTSTLDNSEGGMGKTSAEMKDQDTFTNWVFTGDTPVWSISDGHSRPFLAYQQDVIVNGDYPTLEIVGGKGSAEFPVGNIHNNTANTKTLEYGYIYQKNTPATWDGADKQIVAQNAEVAHGANQPIDIATIDELDLNAWYFVRSYATDGTNVWLGDSIIFNIEAIEVITQVSGNGSISPESTYVTPGGQAVFTITPDEYHDFTISGPFGDVGACGGSSDIVNDEHIYTTNPVTSKCGVNVNFTRPSYTLTYQIVSWGTINGVTPQTVLKGADGTAVEAVPNSGYQFERWSDDSTENPRTDRVVMGNINVSAFFEHIPLTLTYTSGENGQISGTSPQSVVYGSSGSEITAVPDSGYAFEKWSDFSTQNPRTDTNVTEDIDVTASFIKVATSGTGTPGDPYIITQAGDLQNIALLMDKHFRMDPNGNGTDGAFDLTGLEWNPIGSEQNRFTGSLKGKTSGDDRVVTTFTGLGGKPLFGGIGAGADIADIVISGSVNAEADSTSGLFANSILGADGNPALLTNITVDEDSSIAGAEGAVLFGALAGSIEYATLTDISVAAPVTGNESNDYVGGMAGAIRNATLKDPNVTGNVSGAMSVGGIGGYIVSVEINNAVVNAAITGTRHVGGIGGEASDCTLAGDTGTRVSGSVTGEENTGGIIGYASSGSPKLFTISQAVIEADITGGSATGGVAGNMNYKDQLSFSGITVNGNVSGTSNVGGVIGSGDVALNSQISSTEVTGNVTGTGSNIGGVGGYLTKTMLNDVMSRGDVQGNERVGGLVGLIRSGGIGTAAVYGSVTGNFDTGSIVGSVQQENNPTYTTYRITTSTTSTQGTIIPIARVVASGSQSEFTIVPSAGYRLTEVTGCGVTAGNDGETYTTEAVNADCEIAVTLDEVPSMEVTFDPTGGITPDPTTKTVTWGESYGDLPTTTRSGYALNGWYTAASGGTEVTSGTEVTEEVDHTVYAQWTRVGTSGTGTDMDPYVITTATDLRNIATYPDKVFLLDPNGDGTAGTFNVADSAWVPIGDDRAPFTGAINVKNYVGCTITGLNGQPLFDVIGPGARLDGITISGNVIQAAEGPAGLFANVIEGVDGNPPSLLNITVDATSSITGGDGENNIGGLAGTITHAGLIGITVDADVIGTSSRTGGICGYAVNLSVNTATISGNVSGTSFVGGIIGFLDEGAGTFTEVHVAGNVTGGDDTGGLFGLAGEQYSITDSIVTGKVTGGDRVGGVAGTIAGGSVRNVAVAHEVTAVGEHVGWIYGQWVFTEPDVTDHEITAQAGNNGSITPLFRLVDDNAQPQFTLTPDSGYIVDEVTGTCGGTLGQDDVTYTTNAVTQDCTVVATFMENAFTLTVNSGTGGDVYEKDAVVPIQANAPASGEAFQQWTGDVAHVADVSSTSTTVTMPRTNVTVTATYQHVGSSGTGTADDPYVITTADDLPNIGSHLDKHFRLDPNDDGTDGTYNLTGLQPWTPIGTADAPFTGSLKGLGEDDDRLTSTLTGLGGQPLFGHLGPGADVADIVISGNVMADVAGPGGLFARVIAGEDGNPARVTNVTVDNASSITGTDGEDEIGGLAGSIAHAVLTNVTVDADVTGTNGYQVGGLGGIIEHATIANATVGGNIRGTGGVGGLGGLINHSGVDTATISGTVTGGFATGGAAGQSEESTFTNILVTGAVHGAGNVGGILGYGQSCTVTDSDVEGDVTGTGNSVGGIGGTLRDSTLNLNQVKGDVQGANWVGGVGGTMDGGSVRQAGIFGLVGADNGEDVGWVHGRVDGAQPDLADFQITATAGQGGGVTPLFLLVNQATQAVFTAHPDSGYVVDEVTGTCGGNLAQDGVTYTTNAVNSDCTVQISFRATQELLTLIVNNGSGSGEYAAGAEVDIQANAPAQGKTFDQWTGDVSHLADASSASTTVTMPAANVSVTATYKDVPVDTFTLTVTNGAGSGAYQQGRVVSIAANAPDEGMEFDRWTGDVGTVVASDSPNTTLTMPAVDATVTATYREKPVELFSLSVESGTGGGQYEAGQQVGIAANTAPEGQVFDQWLGDVDHVANVNTPNTTVLMPAADVSVRAGYVDLPAEEYELTVTSGTGSGEYPAGQVVGIAANMPEDDEIFDRWTGDVATVANVNNPNTTLTMPQGNVNIAATYKARPEQRFILSVGSGTGSGEYAAGQTVAVAANPSAEGRMFRIWSGDVEHLSNLNTPNTTLIMPEGNVSITALYQEQPAQLYSLQVDFGTGSGDYPAGQSVAIAAEPAGEGMVFASWTGQTARVANVNNPNTTVTIPATDVSLRATYQQQPAEGFALTVRDGTGSGQYQAGRVVSIAADPAPEGWMFESWTGQTAGVANVNNPNTTVTMSASAVSVRATYRERPAETFALNVGSGTGSGQYEAGQVVGIAANEAPEGQVFDQWTGQTSHLDNVSDSNTVVTMPAAPVSVTARYRQRSASRFTLTVTSGTGSGEYPEGQIVAIAAQPAASGKVFDKWTGQTGTVANVNLPNSTLSMPGADVRLTATYKDDPGITEPKELQVNHGTGDGKYLPGRVVSIAADVREGFLFDKWVGQTYAVANVNIPNTTVVMPDSKVVVTATFKPDPAELFRLRQRVFVPETAQTRRTAAAQAFMRANADPVEVVTPAGRFVRIDAPTAPEGYTFDKWIGQTANVDNIHLPQTYVYMPDTDVDVTASYAALPEEAVLEVEGGEGAGTYAPGTVVDIQADEPEEGMMFDKWEGQTAQVANVNLARTTLTMPGTSVRIQAVFREIPEDLYDLTVRGGQGSGEYAAATFQTIESDPPADENQIFARWIGQVANLEDINAEQTTVYMPGHDVEVVASYARFFSVSATAGEGGSISPGSRDVIENERTTFTVTPDDGYRVAQVSGCGGGLSGSSYTTGLITEACAVSASFEAVGPTPDPIPTMSEWGLIVMSVVMLITGVIMHRRIYGLMQQG